VAALGYHHRTTHLPAWSDKETSRPSWSGKVKGGAGCPASITPTVYYRRNVQDAIAIGNAIVDVIATAPDSLLAERGLVKGSMSLVEPDEAEDLYAAMGPGTEVSGGSAANTMAGLASLGGSCEFVGKVADDQLGQVFAHDLRATGVRFDTSPARGSRPTARSLILVTPDAQRTMSTSLGCSVELEAADLDHDRIAASAITYLEGYLWDPPAAKQAFLAAVATAHDAGRRVALTLSDSFCVERYRDELVDLVGESIDILFANEAEITALLQVDDFDRAVAQVADMCPVVAVTRGAAGSVLSRDGETVAVPAAPVAEVVDTTGAGDLYAAGVLRGLTLDLPLERCGALGSLAAAEVISHVGARPLVSLADLATERGLL
jgi:sugar/nucleoside kinase (ribokinase family)